MPSDEYAPRKIVIHPIPGDPKGGTLYVYGDENAKTIVLMSAGFPDDQGAFKPFASRLAKETDTLIGITCLPGYHDRGDKPWTDHMKNKPSGYSFDEMATAYQEAEKALRCESTCPSPKLTGIFHDWGVVPGTFWANRAAADGSGPDELIYFDVLEIPLHPDYLDLPKAGKDSALKTFTMSAYRVVLAGAFICQRYLGSIIGAMFLIFGSILLKLMNLAPVKAIDEVTQKKYSILSPISRLLYMCYPYAKLFTRTAMETFTGEHYRLPSDFSKMPVLYLYGKEKNFMLHSDLVVKVLEREHKENRSKSNAIGLENAGHYLYLQEPDLCLKYVIEFMQKKK
jgi:pimeloyl-ACP methyl ester carboxylesterase